MSLCIEIIRGYRAKARNRWRRQRKNDTTRKRRREGKKDPEAPTRVRRGWCD